MSSRNKSPVPFGKFLLIDRINVGGMAEVFLGKTFGVEGFERLLAVKRILPNMADDVEFINMFVDEARIAVQLAHANIVQIHELGKFESQYYIAMEYVSGKDLRQILESFRKAKKPFPIAAAAYIVSKVCEGLDYAHRKADPAGRSIGLIHRDVSPQNILIGFEGIVKITDFGIAKAEDRASKTQAGVLKGKFGYMSPEQVRGLEIDRRSDVFAVGILLYEMLTGGRLFVGESDFSTLEKVRNAAVTPPSQLNPEISPALELVMLKALARERDERYQWASDLHDDLQQFLIDEQTIYSGKKLMALLKDQFPEEIEKERSRLEEANKAQAPENADVVSGIERMRSAVHADSDVRSEKTMIFGGSTDDQEWNAATQIASEGQLAARGGRTNTAHKPEPSRASTSQKRASTGRPYSAPQESSGKRSLLPLIIGALLSVFLLSGVIIYIGLSGKGGKLYVDSNPERVEVYVAGKRVAIQTPYESELPVGQYQLLLRAPGYKDRAIMVDIVANEWAVQSIQLERAGPVLAPLPNVPGPLPNRPEQAPPISPSPPTALPNVSPSPPPTPTPAPRPEPKQVRVTPKPDPTPEPKPDPKPEPKVVKNEPKAKSGGPCHGDAGRVSVNVKGKSGCEATVGKDKVAGVTPFYSLPAPTGQCDVLISCPDGKSYKTSRNFKAGKNEVVVVTADDLK